MMEGLKGNRLISFIISPIMLWLLFLGVLQLNFAHINPFNANDIYHTYGYNGGHETLPFWIVQAMIFCFAFSRSLFEIKKEYAQIFAIAMSVVGAFAGLFTLISCFISMCMSGYAHLTLTIVAALIVSVYALKTIHFKTKKISP